MLADPRYSGGSSNESILKVNYFLLNLIVFFLAEGRI